MASLKDLILASAAIPKGTSTVAGQSVTIRGLTEGEANEFLSDGLRAGMFDVCALCILDEAGKPLFTADEARELKAGTLSDAFLDIVKLSTPDKAKTRKNS